VSQAERACPGQRPAPEKPTPNGAKKVDPLSDEIELIGRREQEDKNRQRRQNIVGTSVRGTAT
jgi:hypothetical protein